MSWVYETAPDLDRSFAERLKAFPREPDLLVYTMRSAASLAVRTWLKAYHRLTIRGREHIPERACILVANHQSHLDTLALHAALPLRRLHRVFPAAAKDYFFTSMPRVLVAAVVANALPFERESCGTQTLRVCRTLLATPGNVLMLFPEGTRSPDGVMGAFLPGVGTLAAGTDIPVVPCRLRGAHEAWPKGCGFPRPRKVELTIGKPLTFPDQPRGKQGAVAVAAALEHAVRAL